MRGRFATNLVGDRFGRLVVLERAPPRAGRTGKARWHCRCDCGAGHMVEGGYLRSGKSKSCGCPQRELVAARKTRHGATTRAARWPEWAVWHSMISRCHRPKTQSFERYGARGIAVCDRWRFGEGAVSGFECFIADMGRRPSADLSIDRINNDGNHEPSNCRWATAAQQIANRRRRGPDKHPRKKLRSTPDGRR